MSGHGDWTSLRGIATILLGGNLFAIAITLIIACGLPVLLHWIFYRIAASPPPGNFLLLGPSGAGKTAFLSLLETKSSRVPKQPSSPSPRLTHTSQSSTTATVALPTSIPTASNRYRSVNDPSLSETVRNPIRYRIRDTPGHGKLRESQGIQQLRSMSTAKDAKDKVRGVIFMVDAAAVTEEEALRDTATYLHDILLVLQKRALSRGRSASKAAAEIPVLIAANKQDLFTALPPGSVREKLEAEIERMRKSRSRGLMDASADGAGGVEGEGEDDMLGYDGGHQNFTLQLLEDEVGIHVDVVGGAVKGDGDDDSTGSGVRKWEEWIGMRL